MDRYAAPASLPPLSRTLEPTRAPKIKVYKNGDPFFTARQVILRKPAPNFGVLLDHVTESLPQGGGVRRLYTPHGGTRVTSLDQLQDGQSYVAASGEPFRKMNYTGIMTLRQRELTFKAKMAASPPKRVARQPTFAKRQPTFMLSNQPKIVSFVRNGDLSARPFRVIFTKRNTMSWDQVCQIVSDKVRMEAPVRKVYTIGGRRISSADGFVHGETYVAVARIPFRKLEYKPAPPIKSPVRRKKLPPISRKVARVKQRPRPPPPDALPSSRQPLPPVGPPKPMMRSRAPGPPPRVPPQSYIVTVMTGTAHDAGTDAKVSVTLFGSRGETGARLLNDAPGYFASAGVDTFAVESVPVGRLQRIRIEHNNAGASVQSSAWHCKSVAVRDTITDEVTLFQCDRWLAEDRGSFLCVAEIEATAVAPSPSSWHRPASTTALDDHGEYSETGLYTSPQNGGSGALLADVSSREAHRPYDEEEEYARGERPELHPRAMQPSPVASATAAAAHLDDGDDGDLIRTSPMRIALGSPEHETGPPKSAGPPDDGVLSDVEVESPEAPPPLDNAATAELTSTPDDGPTEDPDPEPAELNAADDDDVHDAATKIQAGYRGYRARKDLARAPPEAHAAAGAEGDGVPGSEGDTAGEAVATVDAVPDPATVVDGPTAEELAAATAIQAAYRGYRTRGQLSALSATEVSAEAGSTLDEGAAAVAADGGDEQSSTTEAVVAKPAVDEHAAATSIQAGFRGYQARKRLATETGTADAQPTEGADSGLLTAEGDALAAAETAAAETAAEEASAVLEDAPEPGPVLDDMGATADEGPAAGAAAEDKTESNTEPQSCDDASGGDHTGLEDAANDEDVAQQTVEPAAAEQASEGDETEGSDAVEGNEAGPTEVAGVAESAEDDEANADSDRVENVEGEAEAVNDATEDVVESEPDERPRAGDVTIVEVEEPGAKDKGLGGAEAAEIGVDEDAEAASEDEVLREAESAVDEDGTAAQGDTPAPDNTEVEAEDTAAETVAPTGAEHAAEEPAVAVPNVGAEESTEEKQEETEEAENEAVGADAAEIAAEEGDDAIGDLVQVGLAAAAEDDEAVPNNYDGESVVRLGDSHAGRLNALEPFVQCQGDLAALAADEVRMAELWEAIPKSDEGKAGLDDVHSALANVVPVLSNHPSVVATVVGDPMLLVSETDLRSLMSKAYYIAAIEAQAHTQIEEHSVDLDLFQALAQAFGCDSDGADVHAAFAEMKSLNNDAVSPHDVAAWFAEHKILSRVVPPTAPEPR